MERLSAFHAAPWQEVISLMATERLGEGGMAPQLRQLPYPLKKKNVPQKPKKKGKRK